MILNLGVSSLKTIKHTKVCKRNRQHHLTQTQRVALEKRNSASSFSSGPAGMALNDIWTALMRMRASHGVLNVRKSYLKLHLELKTRRLIFWWSPWGCFSTKLNEKEINLEEINLRRNLCLFSQFVLHFPFFSGVLLQTTIPPVHSSPELPPTAGCSCRSGDEMQQHLASTSHPLSHSYDIGNVYGCTLFLTAPIMPTISWVRRLNQEKGERKEE